VGITKNQLASIEYGRTPLSYAAAYWLIKRLELNPHWLATGRGMRDDYFKNDELPRPEAVKTRVLFTEMMAGDLGKLARELSEIETRRMKHTVLVDAITAPDGKEFDWIEALHEVVLRVTDSKQFRSQKDRQRLAQKLYLAVDRASNEFYRNQVKAVHQANTAAQSWSVEKEDGKALTDTSDSSLMGAVKPQLPRLLERLKKATGEYGKAAALAKFLGVSKESVSRWLSGKMEPGGEVTLKLLKWVEEQER
jgi:transcriptional regulator with XRE-family HTH domain